MPSLRNCNDNNHKNKREDIAFFRVCTNLWLVVSTFIDTSTFLQSHLQEVLKNIVKRYVAARIRDAKTEEGLTEENFKVSSLMYFLGGKNLYYSNIFSFFLLLHN